MEDFEYQLKIIYQALSKSKIAYSSLRQQQFLLLLPKQTTRKLQSCTQDPKHFLISNDVKLAEPSISFNSILHAIISRRSSTKHHQIFLIYMNYIISPTSQRLHPNYIILAF